VIWFTKEEALLFRRRRRRQFRQFRKLFRILSDFLKMRNPTLRTVLLEQSFQPFQFLLLVIIIRFLDFSSFYGFVVRVSVFVAQLAFLSKHLFFLILIKLSSFVSRLFCDERTSVSFFRLFFFLNFCLLMSQTTLSKAKKIEGTFFHPPNP
jgi:hypothetical protein